MRQRDAASRNSARFMAACEAAFEQGFSVRFRARGQSMQPNVLDGDTVEVAPFASRDLSMGDIAMTHGEDGVLLHRVIARDKRTDEVITRGDAGQENDALPAFVLGKVVSIERGQRRMSLKRPGTRLVHALRRQVHRAMQAGRCRVRHLHAALVPALFVLFAFLLSAAPAAAQFTMSDSAAPTTQVAAGGTITYTQVLTATGNYTPSTTNPVQTTQTFPATVTYVSYAVTGTASTHWTCTLTGSTLGCIDTTGSRGNTYGTNNTTTFTITVTIGSGVTAGTVINNSVTSTPGNSNATASTTVGGTPDLSITDAATPNPVATGSNITYTQVVTNNSTTVAAAGATLTETTPAGTLFESMTAPTGWTCGTLPAAGSTGTITCTATGDFAASGTASFTLVVEVRPEATGGSTITNSVSVSETGTDPNPSNNTATASVTVSGADLSLTQAASVTAVPAGQTITYTETVTNLGPNAAATAVLYQATPPNTTFSSITAPSGWTCATPAAGGTGQVTCTDGSNLNTGSANMATFSYVVTVNSGTASGTTIVNTADITSNTTDPVVSNNATTTTVIVETTGDSDLAISMTASPTPVFVSSTVTYAIQVTNLGLASGSGVTVVDTLPTSLSGATATSSQGTCGAPTGTPSTITCNIGTVAYPLTSPITITVTGTSSPTATTMSNSASVSTTPASADPVTSNNSVTVLTVAQPLVCATPGKDGAGGTLTGIVNAYYPATASVLAGTASITLGKAATGGAQTAIAPGDLLLVIQTQDATINSSNTSSYGDGVPGDPGSGSTSLGSSGLFEFVTATNNVTTAGGTLNFTGTGANSGLLNSYVIAAATPSANPTAGQATFQVIRVPQYTSATLSSGLTALAWNGATGGVLALDVSSQLTLGGASPAVTVAVDALGFRGGGGELFTAATTPPTPLDTDYVTLSTQTTNGSKGEGIAGTQRYIANAAITAVTNTGVEGYPAGSFARGAPGNAGGGATDADPTANDQNTGGGGGGNGGTGGTGGFGWKSAGIVGGFGGVDFPNSTNALVMGGGAGAGTTNNGTYWNPSTDTGGSSTGVNSSGAAGGGIVIIHTGSVTGTGTITSNGQSALETENDGGGGGGAGGTILFLANAGSLTGLTTSAVGGNGGITWPEEASVNTTGAGTTFPGNRHGPGGGGGGGAVITSSTPSGGASIQGGNPGWSTLANDAYGAEAGQPGTFATGLTLTQTPGTQSGAYCAGADLSVTNSGLPNPVVPGSNITYTQNVANAGPFDAVNATFSEAIPANTTFQSIAISGADASGWTCTTPAVNGTGNIVCTNSDVPSGTSGNATFTVQVKVSGSTVSGTQITDTDEVVAGTNDPNLANNTATAVNIVGAASTADLAITNTASPNPVLQGNDITYTVTVVNNGPSAASTVAFTESVPTNTSFVSVAQTSGSSIWSCSTTSISCTISSLPVGISTTFQVIVQVGATVASGTVISDEADVSSATADPNPTNNQVIATDVVAAAGQADAAVTITGTPNPVLAGNNLTYTITVTNNGPVPDNATGVTLTNTFPANTTLVSATAASGWTCTPGTGSESCTIATLAPNTSATFTFVVKVTPPSGNPPTGNVPGTQLTDTATVTTTSSDPNSANNTASTSSYVASPSQADVAIVKTASPEPVETGTTLTYTLQVSNNGPATAQNVYVSDPLPTGVAYLTTSPVSTTQGTCTYTSSTTTVTCQLGSISVGGVVIVTINVTAGSFGSNTLVTNTATVCQTASPTSTTCVPADDPDQSNNTSSATSTISSATVVDLVSFEGQALPGGGVVLQWHTREETRNLGFHIYKEDGTGRHQLDPSLIAGSALFLRGGQPQHRAKSYQWLDPKGNAQASYYLEDVDLNGTRTMHGPIYPSAAGSSLGATTNISASGAGSGTRANVASASTITQATLLTQLNRVAAATAAVQTAPLRLPRAFLPIPPSINSPTPAVQPASLNGVPAVKISVNTEGWYTVSQAQLVAAGMNPAADARTLQLYAEGVEQPMLILGKQSGPLGPNDSIQFYGTGIDTPFSLDRVYWLVSGSKAGTRITATPSARGSNSPTVISFPFTVVLEQKTTYFAALLNGVNNDNFFGAVVTSDPVDQQLTATNIDTTSSMPITLDVTLQGVTDQQPHAVSVAFNGSVVGELDFANETNSTSTFSVSSTLLEQGTNTVTLTALDGDNDVSLVQSIALHYPHTYMADSDWLESTASSGETLHIGGFSNAQIQVADITNPTAITELTGQISANGSTYEVTLTVPGATGATHTLLAFASDQITAPAGLSFHTPNNIDKAETGASLIVITHPDFASNIQPLVTLHESQGMSVSVVTTDQIFDAFNYGERSPFAIQSYLKLASSEWRTHPQAVLLVGDASFDPNNYLGFGDFDFVPTRMIETAAFKTASDDWLTDFTGTGFATIPTGRLPVRTTQDADLIVSKIVGYESGSTNGSWTQTALVIADQNNGDNFTSEAQLAAATMPSSLTISEILADGLDQGTATQEILAALNSGALIVNYTGHGSEEQWSFEDLLDDTSASALSNGDRLPVYLLMDCLNGFFQDVYATSLSTSLLLAPNGGAVAVWASSGFTDAAPQATMDQALLGNLATNPSTSLGAAILNAKLGITDPDVRRTWILFGDPAMKLQFPSTPAAQHSVSKRLSF